MTETICCTIEGEEREVTLTRPGGFEYLTIALSAPAKVMEGEFDEEVLEWCRRVVRAVSDLDEEELDSVPPTEINKLICASAQVFAGDEVDIPEEIQNQDYKYDTGNPFEGMFDMDEDGFVDTDEWR